MSTNIILKVELLAGTDISQGIQELKELAQTSKASVECNFNGVYLLITPNTNVVEMATKYREAKTGDFI